MIENIKMLWNKGAFHIFAGSFLTKFVAFFGSIFVVRVLSKEDYGILGYFENIYSYAFIFAGMGLSNAILRYVVLGNSIDKKFAFYKYMVKKSFVINSCLTLGGILIAIVYPHPSQYKAFGYLLIILMLALPFQDLVNDNLYNERAMFANKRFALFSFLTSSVLILGRYLGGIFAGADGVVFLRTIINVGFGIILTIWSSQTYFTGVSSHSISKKEKKEIDNYSLQYMITNGLWAIFMLNDMFLLGRFCPEPAMLADYRVAYVLPGNISLISSAIGTFVTPYFVKHEFDIMWIKKNYIKVSLVTIFFVGGICLTLSVLARPLIVFMYGQQYENVVGLMRLLLIGSFLNCGLRFTTANILAAMGQIKYNMAISMIGVLMQLIINIKIIPIYGSYGIAITSIVVYAFMAIALLIVFIKKYYTR